jgi:Uma2 family endonuclease
MIDVGIFKEDDHVELINGELRVMPPIKARHAGMNKRLNRLFSIRVGEQALVAVQDPLTLPEHSEPEPDLMLLHPREDYYEHANPTPGDVLLVVEVSESSLAYDRDTKIPLYAVHNIPEVWLIDLKNRRLAIYRDPSPEGYVHVMFPEQGQVLAPVLLPDVKIKFSELWR